MMGEYTKISNLELEVGVNLPAPLDKPMEKIQPIIKRDGSGVGYKEDDIAKAVNELIERQNALVEIVKALVLHI